ncbi:MAG: hypothetical protein ABIP39_00840, partial [Polyangiaceae bacterium]
GTRITVGDSGLQGACGRAGGIAGITAINADAMTRLAADCRIGPYFTGLDATKTAHMSDCMVNYLAEVLVCPGSTYSGSKDKAGVACKSMGEGHKNMGITGDDQTAFALVYVDSLHTQPGLLTTDIGGIITQITQQRDINNGDQGNPKCVCTPASVCATRPPPPPTDGGTKDTGPPPPVDSGNDTGSADTGPG